MAGKKGMKRMVSMNQQERDMRALAQIESLLDKWAIDGQDIKSVNPLRLKALQIRYDKLRGTMQTQEITDKRDAWSKMLEMANKLANQTDKQAPAGTQQEPELQDQADTASNLH